jgi:tetratricopeptide (TPR) repeat protein
MSEVNVKSSEYADNLKIIERFFLKTLRSGFLFAVCNDELVQQELNASIRFLLQGKGKTIRIHAWGKEDDAAPPVEQLRALKSRYPDTAGIILTGLDGALYHNPNLLVQLNFGREALSELGIPLLFWLSSNSLQKISVEAIDLYNQRASANLYFEHLFETTDTAHSALHYVALETVHANKDLGHIETRLKLLQQQLTEAEKSQRDPADIANEIVLELLALYAQVPGTSRLIQSLIEHYYDQFDLEKPETCMTLAYAFISSGEEEKALVLTEKALSKYRELAITNPQTYLPHVADTLTHLANLQFGRNELSEAEQGYRAALEIQRELVRTNPNIHLSYLAMTLHNLALLNYRQHKLSEAEQGYREALEIQQELASTNLPRYLSVVATTLSNLANLHFLQHEFTLAEQDYREALEIQRELVHTNPQSDLYLSDVAATLNNLANLHMFRNDITAAEKGYRAALEIRQHLAETNPRTYSPYVATTLNNLAVLQSEKSDFEAAEQVLNEALAIQEKVLGFDHSETLRTREHLDKLHESMQQRTKSHAGH